MKNFEKTQKHYNHFIVFDFESYMKQINHNKTTMLELSNEHIPLAFGVHDTLRKKPTYIYNEDPSYLIKTFVDDLYSRRKDIVGECIQDFDINDPSISRKNKQDIDKWISQVSVFGFNSGRYDINLIKKYFIRELLARGEKLNVAKKQNKYMFIECQSFRFIDISNYIAPGTTYDSWVKSMDCKTLKLPFPYKYLTDLNLLKEKKVPW